MSCALLGLAVARAEPPEKPSYLASMKSVHTVEQTHPDSSAAGTNGLRKDKRADHQNSGETGDAPMTHARLRVAALRGDAQRLITESIRDATQRGEGVLVRQ